MFLLILMFSKIATVITANLQPIYIKSETGSNTVARNWIASPESWKYIYGNWELCSQANNYDGSLQTPFYSGVNGKVKKITLAIETTFPKSCNTETKCNTWLNVKIYIGDKTSIPEYKNLKTIEINSTKIYFRQLYTQHYIDINYNIIKNKNSKDSQIKFLIERHNGSCVSITNFKLYYHQCKIFSYENLVNYGTFYEPNTIDGELTINGSCVLNAVSDNGRDILQKCYANGTYELYGTCICDKEYFRNGTECPDCKYGYFKAKPGNEKCKKCGKHIEQKNGSRLSCPCLDNFFRVPTEKYDQEKDCYEAGTIRKLLYSNYSDATVVVTWDPSFYHPEHFPLYIVTVNDKVTVMKNRVLKFTSTNYTQSFNIKVITEVDVEGKIYRGTPYEEEILVHPNPLLSTGKIVISTPPLIFMSFVGAIASIFHKGSWVT